MNTRKVSPLARGCGLDEVIVDFGMFDFEFSVVFGPLKHLPIYIATNFEITIADAQAVVATHSRARATTYKFPGFAPVVWLPTYPRTPGTIAALAHEAFHVVCHMLEHFGTKLGPESEETYAHALTHVVDEVLTRLKVPRKVTRRAA